MSQGTSSDNGVYINNHFDLGLRQVLPFFPTSRPDETLASRLSRFHVERGNVTTRETFRECFGAEPFAMTSFVLPNLQALAERLPGDPLCNYQRLVREGNLLPIVKLFTASTIAGDSGSYARRSVGEAGSTRICLQCIKVDTEEHGSPHLHLSHQIPAVTACWEHGQKLVDRCPRCGCPIEPPKDIVLAPWQGCICCGYRFSATDNVLQDESTSASETELAAFASAVLKQVPEGVHAENLPRILRQKAMEIGFRRGESQIDRLGLQAAVEEYYTKDLLAQIDRAYATGRTTTWLQFLGASRFSVEGPLNRNLLLANFLFRDANTFLVQLTPRQDRDPPNSCVDTPENESLTGGRPKRQTETVDSLVNRLISMAVAEDLSIKDLWHREYGAMKRITVKGSKFMPDVLRDEIEKGRKKKSTETTVASTPGVNPRDAEWAKEIAATADRLYGDSGFPKRVSIASLVKNAEIRPATWPSVTDFPLTRAACEAQQESQWHFYARRVMWSMARNQGKPVARTAVTEDSGLEHHRATDVYLFLMTLGIVPMAPFAKQLEAKGIFRDWRGPCPEKVYRKVGRGYLKSGVRTAYALTVFSENGNSGDTKGRRR